MNKKYLLFFALLMSTRFYGKESKPTHKSDVRKAYKLLVKDKLKVCGNSLLKNLIVSRNETVKGNLSVNGKLFLQGTEVTGDCPPGCQITTPASATTNAVVLFADPTGRSLTQSPAPVTIDDTNSINNVDNITMSGNLNMVDTTTFSVGVITKNNQPFIHNAGGSSTFVGVNAGQAGGFFENMNSIPYKNTNLTKNSRPYTSANLSSKLYLKVSLICL